MLQQALKPMTQTPVKAAQSMFPTSGSGSAGASGWMGGGAGNFNSFLGNGKDPNTPQGQMDAFNKLYPYTDSLKWRQMTQQLGYAGQQPVLQGLTWYGQHQPQYLNQLSQALTSLNPANRMGRVADFRRDAMGQGLDQANQNIGMLGANSGPLANALRMGAMNDAQQSGNEYMMQQYSPEQDAKNAALAAQLMNPAVSNPLLDWYTGLTMGGEQHHGQTAANGSIGNTIMGLAGAAGQIYGATK